jgi:hypothetical protein
MLLHDTRIVLEGAFEKAERVAFELEAAAAHLARFSMSRPQLDVVRAQLHEAGRSLASCRRRLGEPGVQALLARVDAAEAAFVRAGQHVCHQLGVQRPASTAHAVICALEPLLPLVKRVTLVAPPRVLLQVFVLSCASAFAFSVGAPFGLPFTFMLGVRLLAMGVFVRHAFVSGAVVVVGRTRVLVEGLRRVQVKLPPTTSRHDERAELLFVHARGVFVERVPDVVEPLVEALRAVGVVVDQRRELW